jgi:hypothetical protein
MRGSDDRDNPGWVPSVYYAQSVVRCPLTKAWETLLDYEAWNPTFVGAHVVPVRGEPRTEGELVLIRKSLTDVKGEPLEFYAETVKVSPQRHIVWYVYPKEGQAFRNFVEFGLAEAFSGVQFDIRYYAQNRLPAQLLIQERNATAAILRDSALAFKRYCEAHA